MKTNFSVYQMACGNCRGAAWGWFPRMAFCAAMAGALSVGMAGALAEDGPVSSPGVAAAKAAEAAALARPQWTKWPKRLKEVPFGKKVQYRDTEYWVEAILRADGESELVIYRGTKEIQRMWTGLGGDFAILDTEAAVPVIEGWGEDINDHGVRWLVTARLDGKELRYGIMYMELYTTDKEKGRGTEILRVMRRPDRAANEYWYLGWVDWAGQRDPQKADKVMAETMLIKE